MSQPSSDFDEVGFEESYEQPPAIATAAPQPNYRQRGFSIYTVMLILSTVFLTAAAVVLFIEADKY
jgi:hypothetical protein